MRVADFDASRGDVCPTGWTGMTVNDICMCQSISDAAGCYLIHTSLHKWSNYHKIRGEVLSILLKVLDLVEALMDHNM